MQCKSKPKPKPKADLDTTINDSSESKEDILSPVDTRANASYASSVSHPPDGTILRTDIGRQEGGTVQQLPGNCQMLQAQREEYSAGDDHRKLPRSSSSRS
jgi:hypothetical protein